MIWRIWRVERQCEKYLDRSEILRGPRHLHKVIRVITESGVVYSLMMLACVLFFALQDNAQFLSGSLVSKSIHEFRLADKIFLSSFLEGLANSRYHIQRDHLSLLCTT